MKAAATFVAGLASAPWDRIEAHLYGSLALTGRGHATDRAVLLGLEGYWPDRLPPEQIPTILAGQCEGRFQVVYHNQECLPEHPNGLRFCARNQSGELIQEATYYSVGGGVIRQAGISANPVSPPVVPYPFQSCEELLRRGEESNLPFWQMAWANELAWRPEHQIEEWLECIWREMQSCVERGLMSEGVLPGGLQVGRRARHLARNLDPRDALSPLDWVEVYAMAVTEENAAGGRVVTAPTNGASGVVPAVAMYYDRFLPGSNADGLKRFFLTAAVLGTLYKENASISGAEVGCQGEIGVACSMAAGALVAAQGGSNRCVEKAAEIAMEHHLGLTCDPVGGLVQIPCIERNALAATQAIHASRLALHEGAGHRVSLDRVIQTMLETGRDMSATYKETSLGGLAVNVPLC